MYVACVTVQVLPDQGDAFVAATRVNRLGTRTEPGNVRFDVLRQAEPGGEEEPERFFLYEVYRSPDAFAEHQRTPHYLAWRETVAPMMAAPREGLRYVSAFPDPWE